MIGLVMSEEGFNAPKFYSGSSIVAGASDFISHYLVLCTYSKSINFTIILIISDSKHVVVPCV